ncbi:DUF998 domain-containing protein [Streptomyces sp. NPDC002506]|uniref:DUF998 domain-containing protein n=1 Tax=Streptomyces sp. NPDC002506 TaxID=3154536 RepID=UPI00331EDF57
MAARSGARGGNQVFLLLTAGAVLYSAWITEFFLPTRLSPLDSFICELEAVGRPFRHIFVAGDTASGILITAGSVLAFTRRKDVLPCWHRLGLVSLAAFGLTLIGFSAIFPMECAPSIDTACRSAEARGELSGQTGAHFTLSALSDTFFMVTLGTWSFRPSSRGRLDIRLTTVLAVNVVLVVAVAVLLDAPHWHGLLQRAQVATATIGMCVLARRACPGAPSREAPADPGPS